MLSTNFWLPVKAMSDGPIASGPTGSAPFEIDGRPVRTRSSGPSTRTSVTLPVVPRQNRPSGCSSQFGVPASPGRAPPLPASTTYSSPFGENDRWRGLLRPEAITTGSDWAEAAGAVATMTANVQATAVEALTTRRLISMVFLPSYVRDLRGHLDHRPAGECRAVCYGL